MWLWSSNRVMLPQHCASRRLNWHFSFSFLSVFGFEVGVTVLGVCPVAVGLQPFASAVVFSRRTFCLPCLVVVVRGSDGARSDCRRATMKLNTIRMWITKVWNALESAIYRWQFGRTGDECLTYKLATLYLNNDIIITCLLDFTFSLKEASAITLSG